MITLLHGDNLALMERLRREVAGKVVLAYLDPPFLTNRAHHTTDGRLAFDDRWASPNDYFNALAPRLCAVRDLLAPNGSMVLHLNDRAVHRAKLLCDATFGAECFASEIVWRYRRWPSKTPNFQRMHDTLLRYVRDARVAPRWNQLYEPLAPSTLKTWGSAKQRAVVADGKRVRSSKTSETTAGTPMGDVWDIGVIAPSGRERTGYPTQKPEALLERLILALTDEDELVLDPYAGSGTTLAVAERLGRDAIGIDASDVAIETARIRLGFEPKQGAHA